MFNKSLNTTLFLLILLSCTIAQEKRHFEKFKTKDGKEITYAYYLPPNYDAKKSYPLFVSPGEGKPGSDHGFFMGEDPAKFGWIVVETYVYFEPNPVEVTSNFLDHLLSKFNVYKKKFHTICYSANSSPIFDIVIALADRFESITGIPGHPRTKNNERLKMLKNTKVQFIVGEDDGYWLRESEDAYTKLKELGIQTTLEIVKDGKHVLRNFIGDELMKRIDKLK